MTDAQSSTAAPIAPGIAGPLLQGRTIIVTGAAGGIGRVVSRVLCEAGAQPVLVDHSGGPLRTLDRELGQHVDVRPLDVTVTEHMGGLARELEQSRGGVDGLVNCAGLWEVAPWSEIDTPSWEGVLDANLRSAFVSCQAVLPGMVERRSGSIVNFASTAGEYGSISPASHYAAAKGGVIAMTKSLAREVGPFNVRVNALSPGPTDTAALGAATPEDKARVGKRTLLGRLADPEEMAHGVLYLVGPLATFVTGHVLRVNGGSLL
jgi:NAD(P)-dependent dehydrogenase (short-subunit alcohol dehydrogenase family)